MKNIIKTLITAVFMVIPTLGQDTTKAYVTFATANYDVPNTNTRGINAGLSLKLYGYEHVKLEAVGDFTAFGVYDDGPKVYRYLLGPQVSLNLLDYKLSPFAQVLFGVTTYDGERYYTTSFGGGIDVNITKRFGVRVIQYNRENASSELPTELIPTVHTVKTGVFFKF